MSQRICAPLDQIPQALAKTGFILEHLVAEEFKNGGWATIGGRYYADDIDGRARELDLVAYRAEKFKELDVVTAILISCKKDAETTWAFLTKDKPKHDLNFDWNPIHYWTDIEPLRTYLAEGSWKEAYIKAAGSVYEANFGASRDIFAFQQVGSLKVAPRNDKAIFESIVSLMKALDHELEALPTRAKKKKRIYNFKLLSVVDAPLVEVSYSGIEPVAREVEQINHLARYMVRKRDLAALICFVRSDKLRPLVEAYSRFSAISAKHMESLLGASYEAITSVAKVQSYFAEKMKSRLSWRIESALGRNGHSTSEVKCLGLTFEGGVLRIQIDIWDDVVLVTLNNDEKLKNQVAKILKETARYEREFVFENDVPF